MSNILFAFVGAGRYNETNYTIAELSNFRQRSSFLPHVLVSALNKTPKSKLDRIILLGTKTSSWRGLVSQLHHQASDERISTLSDDTISAEDLPLLSTLLTEVFGVDTVAKIIPTALDNAEQQEFIQLLSTEVQAGDKVHFDLTHGLRHLPMLTLIGALALRTIMAVDIAGIWYGAYHFTNRQADVEVDTPVVRLDGLLSIANWLGAISVFDQTADIDAFSPPLRQDGLVSEAIKLQNAAFKERMQETYGARQSAQVALDALWKVQNSPGLKLVKPLLEERLGWATHDDDENLGFYHATNFINNGNEVRALTIAYETALEKLGQFCHHSILKEKLPQAVARSCGKMRPSNDRKSVEYAKSYLELKDLRNNAVHLGSENSKFKSTLQSPQALHTRFVHLVEILKRPVPNHLVRHLQQA